MKVISPLFLMLCLVYSQALASPAAPVYPFKKVFVVVLENENAEAALSKPFLGGLARRGAYLSNYYAISHPSQPNYLALVSGSTQHVVDDSMVTVVAEHLGDLLEAQGKSWKNYAEGYPGGCYLGGGQGQYARKHVPFVSFNNVQVDRSRCESHIVAATEFDQDLAKGALPTFSLYTPDLSNDGHDTGVSYADRWLQKRFGSLVIDPRFIKDMLFVVIFDEGSTLAPNRVYAALVGPGVTPGASVGTRYDHYSLLRTIEEGLGLATLGLGDRDAAPITGIWTATP